MGEGGASSKCWLGNAGSWSIHLQVAQSAKPHFRWRRGRLWDPCPFLAEESPLPSSTESPKEQRYHPDNCNGSTAPPPAEAPVPGAATSPVFTRPSLLPCCSRRTPYSCLSPEFLPCPPATHLLPMRGLLEGGAGSSGCSPRWPSRRAGRTDGRGSGRSPGSLKGQPDPGQAGQWGKGSAGCCPPACLRLQWEAGLGGLGLVSPTDLQGKGPQRAGSLALSLSLTRRDPWHRAFPFSLLPTDKTRCSPTPFALHTSQPSCHPQTTTL